MAGVVRLGATLLGHAGTPLHPNDVARMEAVLRGRMRLDAAQARSSPESETSDNRNDSEREGTGHPTEAPEDRGQRSR